MLDEEGNETRVLGLKIATIGKEAWTDIDGIFDQCGCDITDPVEGIDVKVTKGFNGTRVCYSAQALLDNTKKPPQVKVTPFTEEEKALVPHNLLQICGKMSDMQRVIDALHPDLRQLLEMHEGEESAKAPAAASSSESDDEQPDGDEDRAIEEALSEDDGDGLLSGTRRGSEGKA